MTEVSFYQVMDSTPASVDATLPSLLNKVLKTGKNVIVKCTNADRMERLDDSLWSFKADSFMAHGTENDDFEAKQPIYLTTGDENPNGADILILLSGASADDFSSYDRVLDMFEASDVQKTNARKRWKDLADKGYPLQYFAFEDGKWGKKA
ncbi:MAG: DNA polymerase-3 subunit chi [Alphaproteobacteria bacterium]|jgi:DNA polymerase-3 subunit chi